MQLHESPDVYKLFGGAMGGGKTAALINEGIQLNLDYPGNFGLLMRKTWPSFRDTVLPQLEKFLVSTLVEKWNHSDKMIFFKNGSKIRYGGIGDKPDDWEKFMSGEYGWVALDQAEDYTENEFTMLSTRLRLRVPNIRYFFLLSCNPNVGWIKERFIESNHEDHVFIPSLPDDNRANLPIEYIDRMRKILTPQQIKALLEGDWSAVGNPDDVFDYQEIQAAMKRNVEPGPPFEIGVDVARKGDDETVIVTREGLKVRIHSQVQGVDTMKTSGEIWICARKLKDKWGDELQRLEIKIDADGVGGGVVDRINEQISEKQEELKIEVIETTEIHGAAKAKDKVKFKNFRAEVHWGLSEILEDLDLPDNRELAAQLMALKYNDDSSGRIYILPKEEIKKKLGRSPDVAEAVIYALASVPSITPRAYRI